VGGKGGAKERGVGAPGVEGGGEGGDGGDGGGCRNKVAAGTG